MVTIVIVIAITVVGIAINVVGIAILILLWRRSLGFIGRTIVLVIIIGGTIVHLLFLWDSICRRK